MLGQKILVDAFAGMNPTRSHVAKVDGKSYQIGANSHKGLGDATPLATASRECGALNLVEIRARI
jgi:hypothetical protein